MTLYSELQKQSGPLRPALAEQLGLISSDCTQCQTCVRECGFLKNHGDPKKIADNYNSSDKQFFELPFTCSLCDLCTAVCPQGISPAKMFLEMRREAFDQNETNFPEHRNLRKYEKRGTSKRFSWYALPENCDTIFFPGCSLSGSRSATTLKVYEALQKTIPSIGIVLDCCTKPSHDLGDEDYFNAMFGEMKNYLLTHGIKTVLIACPNCHKVFNDYGTEFNTRTVYEILDKVDATVTKKWSETVTVHDPCTARFNIPAQTAVRSLLKNQGIKVEEQLHSGKTTFCCGEGGAVSCLAPELAKSWGNKRMSEAGGQRIISYCAGCTQTLGAHAETSHILDLLFEEDTAATGNSKIDKTPVSCFKRLRLKKLLQHNLTTSVTRERTFQGSSKHQSNNIWRSNRQLILIGSILTTALILISQAWTQ
ncbi:MAG: (Fe-S)-binding protein [Desulfuromusa sp.]|nr:(Fe-S)-binding protein [Desulfuromusa sp.]